MDKGQMNGGTQKLGWSVSTRMMSQEDDLTFIMEQSSLKKPKYKCQENSFCNSSKSAGYSEVVFLLFLLIKYLK